MAENTKSSKEEDYEMLNVIFNIFIKIIHNLEFKETEEIKSKIFEVMDGEGSLNLLKNAKFIKILEEKKNILNIPKSDTLLNLYFSFLQLLTINTFCISINEKDKQIRLRQIYEFVDLKMIVRVTFRAQSKIVYHS